MTDISWLAQEAKNIYGIFYSFFYLLVTMLLLLGIVMEYFKIPMGDMPSFAQLVGRVFIAALLLHAYPDITNVIADVTDAVASRLGDLNQFKLVLDRMGDKLGELSWSWVSFKDTVILIISFLTFFLLYFSIHIADAFYLYAWTLLYVFSPLLIALFVLPVTSAATKALFRSLVEIACWKIVWSVIATLLWSAALSNINQQGAQISFLTAISFNIILAGSLLLTPFVVHALAGSGLAGMTRSLGALAIGGMAITPGAALKAGKSVGGKAIGAGATGATHFKEKYQDTKRAIQRRIHKPKYTRKVPAKKDDKQMEFNL
jgi:hypothetical protein